MVAMAIGKTIVPKVKPAACCAPATFPPGKDALLRHPNPPKSLLGDCHRLVTGDYFVSDGFVSAEQVRGLGELLDELNFFCEQMIDGGSEGLFSFLGDLFDVTL